MPVFWRLTLSPVSQFRILLLARGQPGRIRNEGIVPVPMAARARVGIPWHSLLLFSRQADMLSNQFHSDSLSSTPAPAPVAHPLFLPTSPILSPPLFSSPPLYLSIHPCRIVGFNPPEAIKVSTPTMRADAEAGRSNSSYSWQRRRRRRRRRR